MASLPLDLPCTAAAGLGGLGFRIEGLGFRIEGLGFRIECLEFRIEGFRV